MERTDMVFELHCSDVIVGMMATRLKSPVSRVFAQPFVQLQIKENIKVPRHWPLWGESTNGWIPLTMIDDVIKWKHFPRDGPFVRGIHRSSVNSPHKGQWRGALMFSLICVWISGWVNNREAGDLKRYCVHCDVIVMQRTNNADMFPFDDVIMDIV